jgi:hypothetical protein
MRALMEGHAQLQQAFSSLPDTLTRFQSSLGDKVESLRKDHEQKLTVRCSPPRAWRLLARPTTGGQTGA